MVLTRCNALPINMDKHKQPGSARFGNFINYYSFNPPERRIRLLPDDLTTGCFQGKGDEGILALDVGCNAGDLTCGLYEHLTRSHNKDESPVSVKMLGVDVDPLLVQRAKESNPHPENIEYKTLNILEEEERKNTVAEFLVKNDKPEFGFVFAFSVSMWIHLNHGDAGLQVFLKYVSQVGKNLVIEPQPWKCYRTAVRRMKKLGCEPFEHFSNLSWRNDIDARIEEYLVTECGMELVRKFGQTVDWDRAVCLFRKKETTQQRS